MNSYSFWVVRWVPDPMREEFVNVGLIVGSDQGDWAFAHVESLTRAAALGGSPTVIKPWLTRLAHQAGQVRLFDQSDDLLLGHGALSVGWLERQRARQNNIIQISPPRPVAAVTAAEALSLLRSRFLADPDTKHGRGDRKRVMAELDEALAATGLRSRIDLHKRVSTLVGRQTARFDFAVGATRVAQLGRIWSFDRSIVSRLTESIQAWNWSVSQIREGGAELELLRANHSDTHLIVPRDVDVSVIFIPPRNDEQARAFDIARDGWKRLGIDTHTEDELEDVATAAAAKAEADAKR